MGEGLRWGGSFVGHHRLGNGSLFDGPDRLSRHTIENVAETLLTHLRDSLDGLSVRLDVNQVGCAREVVVPQPVVDHLKMPDAFAGPRLQAHQTFTKKAVAGTVDPVEIVRRRTKPQVDVAQFLVRAHHRPYVGRARRLPGVNPLDDVPGNGATLSSVALNGTTLNIKIICPKKTVPL